MADSLVKGGDVVPRGRATPIRRPDGLRAWLGAAERELADLEAADAIADRRYAVACEAVEEAWARLEDAQREREEARADRARVRDQLRQTRARIRRLTKRTG
jgi:chromosome segregation ATPase